MYAALLCRKKESFSCNEIISMSLLGRPVYWYPINAALNSKYIDKYYLYDNDQTLIDFASRFGFEIIEMPAGASSGEATLEEACVHGHSEIIRLNGGENPELLVVLVCNAATILAQDIDRGVEALKADPMLDSAITVSLYNMWSPLRARKIGHDGLLHPFVPFETFGDPRTMNCDRDSQGDAWFADLATNVIRPRNLVNLEKGLPPERWIGQKVYPLRQEATFDLCYEWQLPQTEWWLRQHGVSK